jgi:hypothetical protein
LTEHLRGDTCPDVGPIIEFGIANEAIGCFLRVRRGHNANSTRPLW